MALPRSSPNALLDRVLARARDLAAKVRQTSERVHEAAKEAHRLTEIARLQSERGRELSRAGRQEARAMVDWISECVDGAADGRRRRSGKDETGVLHVLERSTGCRSLTHPASNKVAQGRADASDTMQR